MDNKKRRRKAPAKCPTPKKPTHFKKCTESYSELIQKYKNLQNEETALDTELESLKDEDAATDLKSHMVFLHNYNEIKDFTQMVLGYMANVKHCTVVELHKQYNLPFD